MYAYLHACMHGSAGSGASAGQLACIPVLAHSHTHTPRLPQVRSVPVESKVVPLTALKVAPPKTEELSSVEASMRLDAIASAGACMRVCV